MEEIGYISIPIELLQYKKYSELVNNQDANKLILPDFGVKLIKNADGELEYAAYFSDTGELLKKIYYEGSSVSCIKHYRNNILYSDEYYEKGLLLKKIKYDNSGSITSTSKFFYNKSDKIISIQKSVDNNRYEVKYGYDELERVNSRTISVNSKEITKQEYRYDILDRIVEYTDNTQTIKVTKINKDSELISYTIEDKAGNIININNKYLCSKYIGTEMDLNGHKTTITDKSYTDNVMLKKPYTKEEDLDFAIANMIKKLNVTTKRSNCIDMAKTCINDRIKQNAPLPISIRKKMLFQKV